MFGLGLPEIAIIAVVFFILFGNGKKLEEFARSLGRFSGEFKKGQADIDREISAVKESAEIKNGQ